MLTHGFETPKAPSRVVLLGAAGFVGNAIAKNLESRGVDTLRLGRAELDLLSDGAAGKLATLLASTDTLIVVSAMAPCKNGEMLEANIKMMNTVCDALAKQPVNHILYVSSDAVYADSMEPMAEDAPTAPTALHGVMHLARELMLDTIAGETPLAILRPTLIYGAQDPHNGYGPNRFRRLAQAGDDIVLFGEGEEQRDHVHIDDVAELGARIVMHRSVGSLNAATGSVHSFRWIAETTVQLADTKSQVHGSERNGPMPHNGYRAFDPTATKTAFPDFEFIGLATGLAMMAGNQG